MYRKRPQDAVLEKAMVALGQTHLSRDDYRLFIKMLRIFSVHLPFCNIPPPRPQVPGPQFPFMTAGNKAKLSNACERVSCVF